MSGYTLKVTGAKEVASELNKGADKPIGDNLNKLATKVEALAKKSTVVDTGRLRSSIIHSMPTKESALIGTNVEYAEMVEYGTAKMEARHMEGGSKVLGEGMFTFTLGNMQTELKDFEASVIKEVKDRF